jgi:Domain of unknown function (DUF4411)
MAYLLDTDVFVQAHRMHYPFDVCPGFWSWIDHAHSEKKLFSVKDIRDEILALEDELSNWVKSRNGMFLPRTDGDTYESLKLLSGWVEEHYNAAAQEEFFGAADFFLVGYAHAHSHTVVTHEVFAMGYKVKIPAACKAMDVGCITPFQMLQREGAKFTLSSSG